MKGRVLVIAGSDSGGGAGIQADIKSITALGGFAMTAVTALTAQNTEGVVAIHDTPPEFVTRQIEVVMKDLGADCVKLGMLHSAAVIDAVVEAIDRFCPGIPVVVDPVMTAKGGASLLESDTLLKEKVIPRARLLTPNLPEAHALTGHLGDDTDALVAALLALGPRAVLLKGGHRPGDEVMDLLAEPGQPPIRFTSKRIETQHTHGTGCSLASAIAAGLAQGLALDQSVARARAYVHEAIRTAPGFGRGHGPLNHAHTVREGV